MNNIDPTKPPPPGGGNGDEKHWSHFLAIESKLGAWSFVAVIAVLGIGLAVAIIWGLFAKGSIVRELASVDLARGVITFIFAIGTIGIALLLAFGALLGDLKPENFANAKGVLTVLIGVFGTILGFYFGTAGGGGQKLDVAKIRFADNQLITHISGGTRPYRYSITSNDNTDEKAFASFKSKESDDGWIIETLPQVLKHPSTLTVDVTDGKDQKASQKLDIPKDTKSTPTPPTQKPETSSTRPTAAPAATTPETSPPAR